MVTENIEKLVYTIPEVANILGCSKLHAYQLAQKNYFPVIMIGVRRKVVPVKAFQDWLAKAGNKPCEKAGSNAS